MNKRPEYVTADDERREMDVANVLKGLIKVDQVVKNPRFCPIDLSLIRDGMVVAFAEVKSRRVDSSLYAEVYLSVAKAINMANFANVTGKPVVLVWNFDDVMVGYSIRPGWQAPWEIVMAGRNDRGDPDDMEPMFLVPVHTLKTIHEKE